jgi:hypothetical protein
MGVTLLHFSNCNALPINIVGCALSAPDGSSPRGYSRKRLFSSIGSKYSVVHHTSTRDTSTLRYFNSRYFYFREKLYSPFLKIVAPTAIIETPSYTLLCTYFALVGAIFLLSYIIFFMTSMSTSLCTIANRCVGNTVNFLIFDR